MTNAWLVRHAPTADNVGQTIMGSRDPEPLTAGLGQAAALDLDIDRAVSSPSRRALLTARAIAPELEIAVDPRLRERSFGAWEGRAKADLRTTHPEAFTPGGALRLDFDPPGGEPLDAVLERVAGALADLRGPVLVVGHNGSLRAVLIVLGVWTRAQAVGSSIGHLEPISVPFGEPGTFAPWANSRP